MKDIRHISTSFNGSIIALAEFEKIVQILDIDTREVISEFETNLSFGGSRLAISEDGKVCICGSWAIHGICGYDTKSGMLIWQRKDLKKVQHIQILYSDTSKFFAHFEGSASRIIDINSGVDIDKVAGVKYYFESEFEKVNVLDKSTKIQIVDRMNTKLIANINRQSFATLDLDIASDCVSISESSGPLSCYDIKSGQLKWRIQLNVDGHFLRIRFNKHLNMFIGVSWPFATGGNKKLKYFNKDNGIIEKEIVINCPVETEFALGGQILVTSDRELINIITGEIKYWA